MQHCDEHCGFCAREFWTWVKMRMKSAEREAGRSGDGSFADAAATSVRPPDSSRTRDLVETSGRNPEIEGSIPSAYSTPPPTEGKRDS